MDNRKRMEIEWECTALSNALAYCLDHRKYEDLVALFTHDGVFDRLGHVSRGRDDLLRAMRERSTKITTRHLAGNYYFTQVDEKTAKAVVYNVTYVGEGGDDKPLPQEHRFTRSVFIEFADTYQKTPEGWRISERIAKAIIAPKEFPGG
jgi:hypothetical protein